MRCASTSSTTRVPSQPGHKHSSLPYNAARKADEAHDHTIKRRPEGRVRGSLNSQGRMVLGRARRLQGLHEGVEFPLIALLPLFKQIVSQAVRTRDVFK